MVSSFRKKYDYIDSCVILRANLWDVPEQTKRARELLLGGGFFYVDDVAVMESVHVLTREHFSHTEISDILQTFLGNPFIIYNDLFLDPVFETYKTHPSLSFDDCVLAAHAETAGSTLWTFDKKLAHQSSSAKLLA